MTERDERPIPQTEAEWEAALTPAQFHVLRKMGTERAFTGEYWNAKDEGVYCCAGCGQLLFSSSDKYDSGTGWPSFIAPFEETSIATQADLPAHLQGKEIKCSRCQGHLGHVFDDGPAPTGQRYCVNSAALKLKRGDS